MNHPFIKCPNPLIKHPQLLTPKIIFAINMQECFIENIPSSYKKVYPNVINKNKICALFLL